MDERNKGHTTTSAIHRPSINQPAIHPTIQRRFTEQSLGKKTPNQFNSQPASQTGKQHGTRHEPCREPHTTPQHGTPRHVKHPSVSSKSS
mmetsp:Transcript_29801/g.86452  ORF Transcript_29801/g.86452 Transcript_29801/m.86452 type:complete len:90 (+) Transcript_29801:421-690(+)